MGDVTHVTVNHPTMSDTRTPAAPLEVVFYHFAKAKKVAYSLKSICVYLLWRCKNCVLIDSPANSFVSNNEHFGFCLIL
jgi:hypothetical protein